MMNDKEPDNCLIAKWTNKLKDITPYEAGIIQLVLRHVPKIPSGKREFVIVSESWWGKQSLERRDYSEEFLISCNPDNNEYTHSEFSIRWDEVGPKIEMFDDSWKCFSILSDLFAYLAIQDNNNLLPHELCILLKGLGFVDKTQRENPDADKKEELIKSARNKLTPEEFAALTDKKK